jgi:four helix bundle protein
MDAEALKKRKKQFGIRVINLVEALQQTRTARVLGNQLLRCGTSVGANYRSACRARSRAEFIAKAGISTEEADGPLYWMEILIETALIPSEKVAAFMREGDELIAILTSSIKTAKSRLQE